MVSDQVGIPEGDGRGEQIGGAAGAPGKAAGLAQTLEGLSNDEVNSFVKGAGYDAVLGKIFAEMQAHFLPAKAAGRAAVIHYEIKTPDGPEVYQVAVADGACTTSKGGDSQPGVTLVLSLADFLHLVTGRLNGVQAFMSGKLKVRGDMMLAQTMQSWFDRS